MPNALALDFDGVICDSAGECLYSAYNTYAAARGLPGAASVSGIRRDWYDTFYQMRPYIRDGKDYSVILYFLEHEIPIESQSQFDRQSETVMAKVCSLAQVDNAGELEKHFQDGRRAIRARDEEAWFDMNPLYDPMREALESLGPEFEGVYITTSKPTDAATKILYHNGIEIPEPQLLGKDKVKKTIAKNSQMEAVASAAGIELPQILFLDDQVSHLTAAKNIGVRCFIATWGYNTDEQVEEAAQSGIALLEEKGILEWTARRA
ncbi:MAG: HAD hydrolase-like protein [Planctomycetota bacterium]|nr:HAD hydrolase-like protein [Planctomycetota bacterium]